MTHQNDRAGNGRQGGRNIVLWGFVGIVLFFLLTEHRAHVFGVLPYLLLLACPLMHLFMHRGHHRHERTHERSSPGNSDEAPGQGERGP